MEWTTSIYSLDDPAALGRWQALWQVSPQRTVFSSVDFMKAAMEAYGFHGEMHLIQGVDGDRAGALVCWRQRGPYRDLVIPPFTQYSAILLHDLPHEADIVARKTALEALFASLEGRFTRIRLLVDLPDIRTAQWRGWQVAPRYTYQCTLHDPEVLLTSWSKNRRALLHKNREHYAIEDAPEAIPDVIALCEASYQRHGRSLPGDPRQLFQVAQTLYQKGRMRVFAARRLEKDALEAGVLVLHDDYRAHYWIAGSVPGPAMTVLLGEALPQFGKEGFEIFDFVGANTPSLSQFKRQFGVTLVPYWYLTRITRPGLRLLSRLVHSL